MQLNIRDAAKLLHVSEKKIYEWIRDRKLPANQVSGRTWFNRSELLEWATSQGVNISEEIIETTDVSSKSGSGSVLSFAGALERGGIFYDVEGDDKPSALKSVLDLMPLPKEADRKSLLRVLLAREELSSTGIGKGIAIPHSRNPIVFHVSQPVISLCFLKKEIDFCAIDGEPVHTLFTIVTPNARVHLQLLSRLAFALHNPSFNKVIRQKLSKDEILKTAHRIDSNIKSPDSTG